jgi:hypothetical protein
MLHRRIVREERRSPPGKGPPNGNTGAGRGKGGVPAGEKTGHGGEGKGKEKNFCVSQTTGKNGSQWRSGGREEKGKGKTF